MVVVFGGAVVEVCSGSVTVGSAVVDAIGQDGRVVKASFFCEIAMVTRGFETRLQILPSKVLWYVAMVLKFRLSDTSAILYGAGICRYF